MKIKTPVRMAVIHKSTNKSAGEDVVKGEPSCTVGGNEAWFGCYGKQCGVITKNLK